MPDAAKGTFGTVTVRKVTFAAWVVLVRRLVGVLSWRGRLLVVAEVVAELGD